MQWRTDDNMLWNFSKKNGYIRSGCKDTGTECEDGDSDTDR